MRAKKIWHESTELLFLCRCRRDTFFNANKISVYLEVGLKNVIRWKLSSELVWWICQAYIIVDKFLIAARFREDINRIGDLKIVKKVLIKID